MKRRARHADQLGFSFEPAPPSHDLAGLDRTVASAVARVLKEDPRGRFEIAGAVSDLLGFEVSKTMLDAYSAEARDGHNISVSRFLALIADTRRFDVLDGLLRKIGCGVVVGEELRTVELGDIALQMERLRRRQEMLKRTAPEIGARA